MQHIFSIKVLSFDNPPFTSATVLQLLCGTRTFPHSENVDSEHNPGSDDVSSESYLGDDLVIYECYGQGCSMGKGSMYLYTDPQILVKQPQKLPICIFVLFGVAFLRTSPHHGDSESNTNHLSLFVFS